jgi:hypothetical protein
MKREDYVPCHEAAAVPEWTVDILMHIPDASLISVIVPIKVGLWFIIQETSHVLYRCSSLMCESVEGVHCQHIILKLLELEHCS